MGSDFVLSQPEKARRITALAAVLQAGRQHVDDGCGDCRIEVFGKFRIGAELVIKLSTVEPWFVQKADRSAKSRITLVLSFGMATSFDVAQSKPKTTG